MPQQLCTASNAENKASFGKEVCYVHDSTIEHKTRGKAKRSKVDEEWIVLEEMQEQAQKREAAAQISEYWLSIGNVTLGVTKSI